MIISSFENTDIDKYRVIVRTKVKGEDTSLEIKFLFSLGNNINRLVYSIYYEPLWQFNSRLLPLDRSITVNSILDINIVELALYSKEEYIRHILKNDNILDEIKSKIEEYMK